MLSNRVQIVEIESLNFCIIFDSSLVVVIELGSLEVEATEAHVRFMDVSDVQVSWVELSERELVVCMAYCNKGSSISSKIIVVLNRTSGVKFGGVSNFKSLSKSSNILGKLSCNHLVVDRKLDSFVYMFHLPSSNVLDVVPTSRISFFLRKHVVRLAMVVLVMP